MIWSHDCIKERCYNLHQEVWPCAHGFSQIPNWMVHFLLPACLSTSLLVCPPAFLPTPTCQNLYSVTVNTVWRLYRPVGLPAAGKTSLVIYLQGMWPSPWCAWHRGNYGLKHLASRPSYLIAWLTVVQPAFYLPCVNCLCIFQYKKRKKLYMNIFKLYAVIFVQSGWICSQIVTGCCKWNVPLNLNLVAHWISKNNHFIHFLVLF